MKLSGYMLLCAYRCQNVRNTCDFLLLLAGFLCSGIKNGNMRFQDMDEK